MQKSDDNGLMSAPQNAGQSAPRRTARPLLQGFTLIEIMLVVVIIGILSTVAIPYFQRVTARARRAEALVVLDKLHVYFINQFESYGTFLSPEVTGMLGGGTPVWNPAPAVTTGQAARWNNALTGWQQIPFSFEGGLKLRYIYGVTGASMTITVVGDMPGLGANFNTTVNGVAVSGNYKLTEVLTGPIIDQAEIPQM